MKYLAIVVMLLSNSAYAQFMTTKCSSSDENVKVEGFQDATSILLWMTVERVYPPLKIRYDMIDSDGNHAPEVAMNPLINPGEEIIVPFPGGENLFFKPSLEKAKFIDAQGLVERDLQCCRKGGGTNNCD